jgi:hypothetical protein
MQQAPPPSSDNKQDVPSTTREPQTTVTQQVTISHATPVVSVALSSPSIPQSEDPYDFDTCTIVAVIQLRPRREAGHARQVLLSVQNGTANREDLPLYRLLTEDDLGGPFPPALVALFEELTRQLPERRQRHEQRKHVKASSAGTPSKTTQQSVRATKEKRSQQKVATASTTVNPLPPVPTATPPPQKNDLMLSGFDWFETEQR